MRRIAAIAVLGLAVLVLGLAQLILPGLAARRIRSQLSAYGSVRSVAVHAFPAIELLWHHADSVDIQLSSYRAGTGPTGSLLGRAGGVDTLEVSADVLDVGFVRLRRATLRTRGAQVTATARIDEADLRAAIPFLDNVVPVASPGGTLTLRGSATVIGVSAAASATVLARDGALIVSPDVPFGALATLTLFADPHVAVRSVSAAPAPGGFAVTARGILH